jgi:hypothetical protein
MFHLLYSLDVATVLRYINTAGVIGFLTVTLYGGYKKWWVFGWQFKDAEERNKKTEEERDGWRDIALHGTNLAEQTVDLFKKQQRP